MSTASANPAETIVTIDRRKADRRQDNPAHASDNRRKTQRRRQIDPTTCERDYSHAEIEFMHAMDDYKRSSGRMFPTCSEVLEVVRGLGYVQLTDEQRDQLQLEEAEVFELQADQDEDDVADEVDA